ncbi:MAG: PQQ-binding-like beta-propeller repeat protein, partial [Candidatus Hydrogenedentes bacterium]|nr:PQQ-binding-like beta-propeller repeat protein [Candidatus Hydrogenedentota bacterium]
ELDTGNKVISKQNFSSPTPVTDGRLVWAVTGTGAVVALTMDGEVVWKRNLVEMYGKFGQQFGYASSPLLYDGKLIVQVLHGFFTDEPSYVMAFDSASGEMAWRVERPTEAVLESPDSYGTPTLLRYPDKVEIIVTGGNYVTAHDPATGAEVWRASRGKSRCWHSAAAGPALSRNRTWHGSIQSTLLMYPHLRATASTFICWTIKVS